MYPAHGRRGAWLRARDSRDSGETLAYVIVMKPLVAAEGVTGGFGE
jgi:hypothetical protein